MSRQFALPGVLPLVQSAAATMFTSCEQWRAKGQEWFVEMMGVPTQRLPVGWARSAPSHTDDQLLHKLLWHDATAGLDCDMRIGHGVEIHGPESLRCLLPPTQPYLFVTFARPPDIIAKLRAMRHQLDELENAGAGFAQASDPEVQTRLETLRDEQERLQKVWHQQPRQPLVQQIRQFETRIAHVKRLEDQARERTAFDEVKALRDHRQCLQRELKVLKQQWEPTQQRRELTVVIGLDGLPQEARNAWNRYVKRESRTPGAHIPRQRWSTMVRTRPWNALVEAGWRLLWVAQASRGHERIIDDITAHFVIYLWQADMVTREDIDSWLRDYIQRVSGAILAADVDYLCEIVLKTFCLPMHASTLQVFLEDELRTQRRDGGIDRRLVRNVEVSDNGTESRYAGERPHQQQRHSRRKKPPLDSVAQQTCSVREAADTLHSSEQEIRRLIREGEIAATKTGRYWRIPRAAVDKRRRRKQLKELKEKLMCLRVLWRSKGHQDIDIPRDRDNARKWVERRSSGDALETIRDALHTRALSPQHKLLLNRAQELLEHLGSDVTWDAWRGDPRQGDDLTPGEMSEQ